MSWAKVDCDKLQGILVDFRANGVEFETYWVMWYSLMVIREEKRREWSRMRRLLWVRHISYKLREFGPIVDDSRWVEALWVGLWWVKTNWGRLRHVGTRKWWSRSVVDIGWAKMRRPLWVRHICCEFGEVSGLWLTIGEEWRHFGFGCDERKRRGTVYDKLTTWKQNDTLKTIWKE